MDDAGHVAPSPRCASNSGALLETRTQQSVLAREHSRDTTTTNAKPREHERKLKKNTSAARRLDNALCLCLSLRAAPRCPRPPTRAATASTTEFPANGYVSTSC